MATATATNGAALEQVLEQPVEPRYSHELMQMKMENESIMTRCDVRPRDFEQIKAYLAEQLDAFPEMSEASIYAKPVGKDPATGRQKIARGLSIRSAETLAEAYGYNRVRADVSVVDENTVKIEATFVDFQRGRIWQDAGILSQFYKARGGNMTRIADDRFYGLIVKAEVSRRVREVILRSVNQGLKAWFQALCERKLGERLTDDKVNEIVSQFAGKKISLAQLEEFVGRPRKMGWTKDDRTRLVGAWTALNDGESTAAELFGDGQPAAPAKTAVDEKTAALSQPTLIPEVRSIAQVLQAAKTREEVHEMAAELRLEFSDGSRNDEIEEGIKMALSGLDSGKKKRTPRKAARK